MIKTLSFTLLTGLLFFTQSNSWAAEEVEKIHIDADHMPLNIETGYIVYTGNVKITQGELKLNGDKVTLQQSNDEAERTFVVGNTRHYKIVTENGEKMDTFSRTLSWAHETINRAIFTDRVYYIPLSA